MQTTPRRKPSRRRAGSHLPPYHDNYETALYAIRAMLRGRTGYDAFPVSFRLIVLDTKLSVTRALQCLLANNVVSAPLWNSDKSAFSGMLTVLDIIHLIQYYYKTAVDYDNAKTDVDKVRLESLREIEKSLGVAEPPLLSEHPNSSMLDAAKVLMQTHAKRLPLLDRDTETGHEVIVSVLTQYRLLKFIALNCPWEIQQLHLSLRKLKIGTYVRSSGISPFHPIATATLDTPVFDVVHMFSERSISAVPIIDEDGIVVDMYETVDVMTLVRLGVYQNLDLTISEALKTRSPDFLGVVICTASDSLRTLMELIKKRRVHRLVVVEGEEEEKAGGKKGRLLGIITLSDVLRYVIGDQDIGEGNEEPQTEWLNMGYWKNTKMFPEACEALALKLVKASGCKPGSRVLDVGHGTGESLIMLLTHPAVPRPSHLTGITDIAAHHQRSQSRVTALNQSVPFVLYTGDAVHQPGAHHHPLDPSSDESLKFDQILALDCAYHFRSRATFLRQAYERLHPGGSVALADICFANGALEKWSTRWVTAVLGAGLMPRENMVSIDEYIAQMHEVGFTDIWLEDITQDVFPGFVAFLNGRGAIGWTIFSGLFNMFHRSGGRFVLNYRMLQSVLIPRYEERASPSPHTVYEIRVRANVRDWSIWRRYSEFDDLHSALKDACHEPPPASLPPKHSLSIFRSHSDPKLLEERRTGLELYLRTIVSAKDDKWRETFAFKEFLGIPIGKQVGGSGEFGQSERSFTLASWLDEHIDLQARIRDVRADINKRDALSDVGDTNGAHTSNVAAKKKLAGIITRVGKLAAGLQELAMGGMSEGELQRRTDMIARLRDDCEKLGKMVTVARFTSRAGGPSAARNPAPDSDREALMGGAPRSPPRSSKAFGRVFGAAAAKPQETEETRPLDEHGLFLLQEQKMQQQDVEVSQLTAVLQRQRHLGEAISNELQVQIELLDDLANRVDDTSARIASTNREMGRLR
ncbi:hypothetical protein R3P38DRAFT_3382816 [Favolaschia claudopus]|uniref:Uncharacterized protein n=1 Tax=Favolaschia claudopus TaxID=2862362 RepID=A0AAW0EHF9_9AGAR